jgi:hypothetical protein
MRSMSVLIEARHLASNHHDASTPTTHHQLSRAAVFLQNVSKDLDELLQLFAAAMSETSASPVHKRAGA